MGNKRERLETVSVPEGLKERILNVVDSKYMRDYLAEDCDFNIYNWVDLIGGSPRPMDMKLKLLRELLNVPMGEKSHEYLKECTDEADSAMRKLYDMNPERSVLLAYYMHSEYIDPFADYAEPCRSYGDFLDHAREDIWEEDCPLEEQSDYQDSYYILDLFDVADGKYKKMITYFCTPNGKVQYYHRNRRIVKPGASDFEREKREMPFAGKEGLEYWSSPYKVGDILYVDMRPYFKPTYCLIDWIWDEGPGDIQCLFLTAGGVVEQFGFKHGRFLPHMLSDPYAHTRQFYSPLYRAELYTGELPEEYAFMKPLSERLKADPEMSQRIDDAFTKGEEKNRRPLMFVYRPVEVKEPDWGDEAPELDVVWHPQRKEREWWEDIGLVDGITKERLLEIAGCSEPGGSESDTDKED